MPRRLRRLLGIRDRADRLDAAPQATLAPPPVPVSTTSASTGTAPISGNFGQYQPLVGDEIRLLRLLRNEPGGLVELSIHHYSLASCPRYDALSYLWGPPPPTAAVLLDGETVSVRANLEAFLREAVPAAPDPAPEKLLLPGPEVDLIWIDALCINQVDIPERNAQVTRMADIYTRADRVLAWLGPEGEDDNSDLAMDTMRNMSLSAINSEDERLAAVVKDQMDDGDRLRAIINLVQADYWRRAWIVQEVTAPLGSPVSRHGPVVWCGDRRMSWALFTLASLRIYRYVTGFVSFAKFQSILGGNDQWLNDVRNARLNPAAHPPLTMLRVMEAVQGVDATDPRDMIYAFMALAVDGTHPGFRPDYGSSVEEVYRRFATHLICHTNSLDVLGHCLVPRKWTTPSWAPDWTTQPLRPLVKQGWTKDGGTQAIYAASGTRDGNCSFDGPVLSVDGLVVDRVAEVAPPRSYEKLGAVEEDWPLAEAWTAVGIGNSPEAPYVAGGTVLDAFRHTLCADVMTKGNGASQRGHAGPWPAEEILAAESTPVDTFVVDYRADFVTRRRSLFRLNQGYLGLSSGSTVPDDYICVLYGSVVPVVLRKKDSAWTVVGECYVHGLMDGEALQFDLATTRFDIE